VPLSPFRGRHGNSSQGSWTLGVHGCIGEGLAELVVNFVVIASVIKEQRRSRKVLDTPPLRYSWENSRTPPQIPSSGTVSIV